MTVFCCPDENKLYGLSNVIPRFTAVINILFSDFVFSKEMSATLVCSSQVQDGFEESAGRNSAAGQAFRWHDVDW